VSTIIWIMGLSGSGKTTTAKYVIEKLRKSGETVVHLDGDDLRDALNQRASYDQSDREKLALSYARLSHLIASQGPTVVISSIGLYSGVQSWMRENIDCYVEVFLDASMELLISRDSRGIYSRSVSESGPVVGKDFSPQFPGNPELHLVIDGSMSVDVCGDAVLLAFEKVKQERGAK
jgi:adenylylsulfate kinase-like enzyme